MTTPTEISLNGSQHTPKAETPNKSTPNTTTFPSRAVNGTNTKMNGHIPAENGSYETSATQQPEIHLKTSSPPLSSPEIDSPEQPHHIPMTSEGSSHEGHSDASPEQAKRDLYVGNLHPRVMPHMLKDLFGGDEFVENVKIVPDRNLSHGGLAYGFVTMVSRAAAEDAMARLQGHVFFGLDFRINWATPTKSAEQGLALFVGDIGPDVSVEDLRNAFQDETNSVADARIVMDPASGRTKGYGFVTFKDTQSAERALTKNGEILKGRKMRVNWASTTSKETIKAPSIASTASSVPQPYMTNPADMYVPAIPGMPPAAAAIGTPNEVQMRLTTLAQMDGLDISWWFRLPPETQAGIIRVSNEAPGAKVVWVGNLEKGTTQQDIGPLFAAYGIVEEITMVSANGYAFVSMTSHLMAATLIVIFKDFAVRGRKIKTGWSHSTQRQLQQQMQAPLPGQMVPPRAQPGMQMQPQMTAMAPMAPTGYMYPQQPMMYHPYATPPPVATYPMMHHGTRTPGTSTPMSTTSGGSATPATQSAQPPSSRDQSAPASR